MPLGPPALPLAPAHAPERSPAEEIEPRRLPPPVGRPLERAEGALAVETPAVRPTSSPAAAVVVPPEPQPSDEARIEVRIGRIELRAAPPPAPAPAPAAQRGFEEFAAKRNYQDRKWT